MCWPSAGYHALACCAGICWQEDIHEYVVRDSISLAMSAGQQGPPTSPTPSETLAPPSAGGTLPTAPLAEPPIKFGSSPIVNGATTPSSAKSTSPNVSANDAQPPQAVAIGIAAPPGSNISSNGGAPAPSQEPTVLNTALGDLPVTFNPAAYGRPAA